MNTLAHLYEEYERISVTVLERVKNYDPRFEELVKAKYEQSVVRGVGDECWTWTGTRSPNGYGRIYYGDHSVYVHRYAYERFVGPIPDGLYVLHKCDYRPCSNPAHLFTGTHLDNIEDMVRKGRTKKGHQVIQCPKGHPYDRENSGYYRVKGGRSRYCRTCKIASLRAKRARAKEMGK